MASDRNAELKNAAETAINRLYGDQSVSPEKAIENMEDLIDVCRGNIDALRDDLKLR